MRTREQVWPIKAYTLAELYEMPRVIRKSVNRLVQAKPQNLLEEHEVIKVARPYSRRCGIYFLLDASGVCYVGQSTDVDWRIKDHRKWIRGTKARAKDFTATHFIACHPRDLSALETAYILKLKPKYNMMLNGKLCLPCKKTANEIKNGDWVYAPWVDRAYLNYTPVSKEEFKKMTREEKLEDALKMVYSALMVYAPDYMHGIPRKEYEERVCEALYDD